MNILQKNAYSRIIECAQDQGFDLKSKHRNNLQDFLETLTDVRDLQDAVKAAKESFIRFYYNLSK